MDDSCKETLRRPTTLLHVLTSKHEVHAEMLRMSVQQNIRLCRKAYAAASNSTRGEHQSKSANNNVDVRVSQSPFVDIGNR